MTTVRNGNVSLHEHAPTTFGALSSQGVPVIASTASAPPTPIANIPKPEALGVWESVPSLKGAILLRCIIWRRDKLVHQHSRRGVVFEDDLVNDTRSRLPEFDSVLLGRALQKVEDLLVADYSVLFSILAVV